MPRIFISYRRADSIGITGRIYDRMVAAFGKENVFQDVEDIPFGVDFRKFLREQVAACDVVLVVIGRQWVTVQDEQGRRRLDNPADFVRIEVENALSQDKVVIPVLVDNAMPPQEAELPPTIQELCYRNAAWVRHNPDFDRDVNKLIGAIQRLDTDIAVLTPQPPLQKIRDEQQARVEVVSPIEVKPAPKLAPPDVTKILPPPFEWCEIPAGKVTLQAGGYVPTGGQTFEVDRFWMAKYPVTNAQYARFIEAGGYREKRWWSDAGWQQIEKGQWTEPRYWTDEKWNELEQPVVGISWYEAIAFCL